MPLKVCRAGNPDCGLTTGRSALGNRLRPLPCDVCCAEPGFCPECKCILCSRRRHSKTEADWIQCLQAVGNGVCGHSVHLECALDCRMAGVVRDCELDVEYLCRRCDKKMDLLPRASELLESAAASKIIAEKNVRLAARLVTGTQRPAVKALEKLVGDALAKVDVGGDVHSVLMNGNASSGKHKDANGAEIRNNQDTEPEPAAPAAAVEEARANNVMCATSTMVFLPEQASREEPALAIESLASKYQTEIQQTLQQLSQAQKQEYEVANKMLCDQMNRVLRQYQLLETDKFEPVKQESSAAALEAFDAFMSKTLEQLSNMEKEREQFDAMLQIRYGFGSMSRELLRNAFNWPPPEIQHK